MPSTSSVLDLSEVALPRVGRVLRLWWWTSRGPVKTVRWVRMGRRGLSHRRRGELARALATAVTALALGVPASVVVADGSSSTLAASASIAVRPVTSVTGSDGWVGVSRSWASLPAPVPAVAEAPVHRLQAPAPLSTSQCLARLKIRCYTPLQYQVAYDLQPLYRAGITGSGRTIVIVDSFGSPTIRHDLVAFDRQWGLPNPTLDIYRVGRIPTFDDHDATMVGWAEETTLDVEYAHAVAPRARIVLVETPVAESEGAAGFPPMMAAEKTLIDQGVGDVISMSFGATENTFPGFTQGDTGSLRRLRVAFVDAVRHQVTVVAASGDSGATDPEADGTTLYPYRVNSWPSTDPLVTSVGGTQLVLTQSGRRLRPDQVWDDRYGASGGGMSAVFPRPAFQNGVRNVVGDRRGTPDISMSGGVNGGCWVYESFEPGGAGWEILGGTSEATPLFAGIVALADQAAGHRLGDLNPALYALGLLSRVTDPRVPTGIVDVTHGTNSFGHVAGYPARPGYDLASGWGTINAAVFVPALARLADPSTAPSTLARYAAAAGRSSAFARIVRASAVLTTLVRSAGSVARLASGAVPVAGLVARADRMGR